MNKFRLFINKNTIESIEQIFDYFSNHEVDVIECDNYYQIELLKRTDFLYVEKNISINNFLKFLNISKSEILNYYILGDNYIFSLLESWIPYGWSKFFVNFKKENNPLFLLHFDDHCDLMPPIIGINNKKWIDIITGKEVKFFEPNSIKQAIYSGAITLGSILTILIHAVSNIHILHLKQKTSTLKIYIEKLYKRDSFFLNKKIMALKFTKAKYNYKTNEINSFYLRTQKISEIIDYLQKFPNSKIFLHIDMDFFSNRFNGSSDWKNFYIKNDLNISSQKQLMESIFTDLKKANLIKNIQHISIGVSPGFYPLEYWEEGIYYLLNCMENVGLNINELKDRLKF